MPGGYNTTKIQGNTELSFLPGENIVLVNNKANEDIEEEQQPNKINLDSNAEADLDTGVTLKLPPKREKLQEE